MRVTVLEGFAGPGGLSEAARMVGLPAALGIESNADACATAHAAGHARLTADIRTLDPAGYPDVRVWLSAPPCQTYTRVGRQSGICDHARVLGGIVSMSDLGEVAEEFTDPRTPLVIETLRFAVELPALRVLIAEQVPPVRDIWIDMCAELATFHLFESVNVITVSAQDFGAPTRRTRVFLVATRDYTPDLGTLPHRGWWQSGRFDTIHEHAPNPSSPFPRISMAHALGWPPGIRINTRGDRKTAGGNEFSADGPAQSLTGNGTRTWYRTDLGSTHGRIEPPQAGLLQGFPADYPWQGSRTSRFQRIADTVSPLMGAAVIGATCGRPWQTAVWERLQQLYGIARPTNPTHRICGQGRSNVPAAGQLDLFEQVA